MRLEFPFELSRLPERGGGPTLEEEARLLRAESLPGSPPRKAFLFLAGSPPGPAVRAPHVGGRRRAFRERDVTKVG